MSKRMRLGLSENTDIFSGFRMEKVSYGDMTFFSLLQCSRQMLFLETSSILAESISARDPNSFDILRPVCCRPLELPLLSVCLVFFFPSRLQRSSHSLTGPILGQAMASQRYLLIIVAITRKPTLCICNSTSAFKPNPLCI